MPPLVILYLSLKFQRQSDIVQAAQHAIAAKTIDVKLEDQTALAGRIHLGDRLFFQVDR